METNKYFFVNHNYGSGSIKGCACNSGNKFIQYAIFKLLLKNDPVNDFEFDGIYNILDWKVTPDEISKLATHVNNNFTHTIWNLQDHIRPFTSYYGSSDNVFKNINEFLSLLTIPVIPMGLGINWMKGINTLDNLVQNLRSVQPNCLRFVSLLSEKAQYIGIRGHLTEYIFNKLGIHNTYIIGCPTMYIDRKPWVSIKEDSKTNRVIANIELVKKLAKNNVKTSFIIQDIYDLSSSSVLEGIKKSKDTTDDGIYIFYESYNMEKWKNFTRENDFSLTRRVHQTLVCINQGVPAFCANPDPRACEMMEYIGLPIYKGKFPENEADIQTIIKNFPRDEIDERYKSIHPRWNTFLSLNNLS